MIQYPNIRTPYSAFAYEDHRSNYFHDSHARYLDKNVREDTDEFDLIDEGNRTGSPDYIKRHIHWFVTFYATKMRHRYLSKPVSGYVFTMNNRSTVGPIYRHFENENYRIPICKDDIYEKKRSPIRPSKMSDIMTNSLGDSYEARYYANDWARKEGYQ